MDGSLTPHTAGEPADRVLRVDFDCRLMLHFYEMVVTSCAGLIADRELDDALGAIKWRDFSATPSPSMRFVSRFMHSLATSATSRALATPMPNTNWSMTTLREKLIKISAKVVGHSAM